MEKNFVTTVYLNSQDIVRDPDAVILKTLKDKYENVCFKQYFIIEIKKVVDRGHITFSRNDYGSKPYCDVVFCAHYITYEVDQLVGLKINEIAFGMVFAGNDHIIAQVPLDEVEKYFKPKIGDYFVAIVDEVNYETFSKVAMNVSIYTPIMGYAIARVVPGDVSELVKTATQNCLEYVKNALKNKDLGRFIEIFTKTNKSKLKLKKFSIFDEISKIAEEQLCVICMFDPLHEGIYYVHKNLEDFDGYASSVSSDAVPIEAVLYKYAINIYNFIVILEQFAKMTNEEFSANKHVWAVYH